jgi:hypothetical protein
MSGGARIDAGGRFFRSTLQRNFKSAVLLWDLEIYGHSAAATAHARAVEVAKGACVVTGARREMWEAVGEEVMLLGRL